VHDDTERGRARIGFEVVVPPLLQQVVMVWRQAWYSKSAGPLAPSDPPV
jgi:hypothetical protein